MGLYAMVTESIAHYTGLSPTAFFTISVLMVVVYKLVCGCFVAASDYVAVKREQSYALREPVLLGDVTEEELRAYDGSNLDKPLLMAIKGNIYDVSRSRSCPLAFSHLGRMFYGPGGPYALFAGKEASRALALMSFEPHDLTGNLDGLSPSALEVLQDWEYKFMEKYVKVGRLVSERTRTEHSVGGDNEHDGQTGERNKTD